MNKDELIIGKTYFMATYEDPAKTRPVILSFEYLGMLLHEKKKGSEPFYHFNFIPPFHTGIDADFPLLHMLREADLRSIVNLDGLITELEAIRK